MSAKDIPRGFHITYAGLIAVVLLAGFGFGHYAGRPVRVVTDHVVVAPTQSAQLLKALGKPDQVVDGVQVNPALKGSTCAVFSARKLLVCYAP